MSESTSDMQSQLESAEKEGCARQPAVFVNRYWLALAANHVRIAFMEILPPYGNVRAAIIMDKHDAKALADSINLLLSEGGASH